MQSSHLNKMNNHFIAHIIRDTFIEKNFTVIYGDDCDLRDVLLLPEHSIGAFQIHSNSNHEIQCNNSDFWNIGLDNPYINYGDVDLFISINYNPLLQNADKESIAKQVKYLLKINGKALIVNPGDWAAEIGKYLSVNNSLTNNIKRYSIFKNENAVVYENI